jgi:hypothetical protein
MKVKELIEKLQQVNKEKEIIIITEGDTYHIDNIYVWKEMSDNPEDSPVELITSV